MDYFSHIDDLVLAIKTLGLYSVPFVIPIYVEYPPVGVFLPQQSQVLEVGWG
jgi:hypothetical protein